MRTPIERAELYGNKGNVPWGLKYVVLFFILIGTDERLLIAGAPLLLVMLSKQRSESGSTENPFLFVQFDQGK